MSSSVVQKDPFWDGNRGGGVRCSSNGDDAKRYHDTSSATLESSDRSVAQCIPGGVTRGVIIPRATIWGDSQGFNCHKPKLVNIDPLVPDGASVIDCSKLTKEAVEQAYQRAIEQVGEHGDQSMIAAQTYRNLSISTEPVGMGNRPQALFDNRRPPMAGNAYVVPKSGPGGDQLQPLFPTRPQTNEVLMSPSVASTSSPPPPRDTTSVITEPQIDHTKATQNDYKELVKKAVMTQNTPPAINAFPQSVQTTAPLPHTPGVMFIPPAASIPEPGYDPSIQTTLEIRGFGKLSVSYHAVVKNGLLLVFVWHKKCKNNKVFPPQVDASPDGSASIAVVVHDAPNELHYIHSTGATFEHGDYEYCVTVVDKTVQLNN